MASSEKGKCMFARHAIAWILGFASLCANAQNPTITVSTNNTPQDRKALELIGQEAFRRAGVEFRLRELPSERSLIMANDGDIDGEGLRVAGLSSQYPNLIQIPERFIGISFVAFSKNASIHLNEGWDSLKPYRVAFITGWKLYEANATVAKSTTKVEKPEHMFKMLDSDRVDLALYTRADGNALVRSMGLPSIAALTPSLKDADMFLYLHKKHEALVPRIAKALRDMKSDGTYNKILAEAQSDSKDKP